MLVFVRVDLGFLGLHESDFHLAGDLLDVGALFILVSLHLFVSRVVLSYPGNEGFLVDILWDVPLLLCSVPLSAQLLALVLLIELDLQLDLAIFGAHCVQLVFIHDDGIRVEFFVLFFFRLLLFLTFHFVVFGLWILFGVIL